MQLIKIQLKVIKNLFLIILSLYILFSPAAKQVFGYRTHWIREWVMFHGYGVDICAVNFYDSSYGKYDKISRIEALGYKSYYQAPLSVRRLRTKNEVYRQARQICYRNKLQDLRADIKCGSRSGWVDVEKSERNLCG